EPDYESHPICRPLPCWPTAAGTKHGGAGRNDMARSRSTGSKNNKATGRCRAPGRMRHSRRSESLSFCASLILGLVIGSPFMPLVTRCLGRRPQPVGHECFGLAEMAWVAPACDAFHVCPATEGK